MWQSLIPRCSQSKWKKTDTYANMNPTKQRVGWRGNGLQSERPAGSSCNLPNERRRAGGAGQGQCSRNRKGQRKCLSLEHRGSVVKQTAKKLRTSRLYEKNSFEFSKSNWLHFSHCQINFQGVWAPDNSFQHLLRHLWWSVAWCIKKQATDGIYVFFNIVLFLFSLVLKCFRS